MRGRLAGVLALLLALSGLAAGLPATVAVANVQPRLAEGAWSRPLAGPGVLAWADLADANGGADVTRVVFTVATPTGDRELQGHRTAGTGVHARFEASDATLMASGVRVAFGDRAGAQGEAPLPQAKSPAPGAPTFVAEAARPPRAVADAGSLAVPLAALLGALSVRPPGRRLK
jgi:hypothetical protein